MKINYNNTCLHFLEHPQQMDYVIADEYTPYMLQKEVEQLRKAVYLTFNSKTAITPSILFGENIQYVSTPFIKAYEKGKGKLKDIFDKEELAVGGTLIFNNQPGQGQKIATHTLFYHVETAGTGENWRVNIIMVIFQNAKNFEKPILIFFHADSIAWPNCYSYHCQALEQIKSTVGSWIGWLIGFLCFCKYCEIETKVVAPSCKEHHAGEKYLNETKSKVEILDSSWFTTVISSGAFTVGAETGGFFRWQPYGPGATQRRLKWIMPFEKEGYIRKAKVLLHGQ